jgi:multidrug efflux pump
LSTPIERVVSAIGGVDYVESTSRAGVSTVTVHLKLTTGSTAGVGRGHGPASTSVELPTEAEPPVARVQRADRPYASFYLSFTSSERPYPP